jgi:hypothetical protein
MRAAYQFRPKGKAICPPPAAEFCMPIRIVARNTLRHIPVSSRASQLGPCLVGASRVSSGAWDCWNFLKEQEWPKDCKSERVFWGCVADPSRRVLSGGRRHRSPVLSTEQRKPDTLDREPTLKRLCGFLGFTKLEKFAHMSQAFRDPLCRG